MAAVNKCTFDGDKLSVVSIEKSRINLRAVDSATGNSELGDKIRVFGR